MHRRIIVCLAAIAAALSVFAGSATAATTWGSGSAAFVNGSCPSCLILIHNNTTGANGSTRTDSFANWTAGGFVLGNSYSIKATVYCNNLHTTLISNTITETVTAYTNCNGCNTWVFGTNVVHELKGTCGP